MGKTRKLWWRLKWKKKNHQKFVKGKYSADGLWCLHEDSTPEGEQVGFRKTVSVTLDIRQREPKRLKIQKAKKHYPPTFSKFVDKRR